MTKNKRIHDLNNNLVAIILQLNEKVEFSTKGIVTTAHQINWQELQQISSRKWKLYMNLVVETLIYNFSSV